MIQFYKNSRQSYWLPVIALSLLILNFVGCQSRQEPISTSTIVVQNYYWAKPGLVEEVYQQRLLASEIRAKFGHPVGRVLKLINQSDSMPDVMWECEYPNLEARELDAEKLSQNEEFKIVAEKMGTLINKFDRAIYSTKSSSLPTTSH